MNENFETLEGVREYAEEYPVKIGYDQDEHRIVIKAINEGGYNCTLVDLIDLIDWIKKNRPELI